MINQLGVLHLNTQDTQGGAARAAYRLHCGLRQQGVDSTMLVAEKSSIDPTVVKWNGDPFGFWRRRLRWRQLQLNFLPYWPTRPAGYGPFHSANHRGGLKTNSLFATNDIINLHWINGFVDLSRLFQSIYDHKPVVWTMHDMFPLTGGCHYNHRCEKFRQKCQLCPQLGSRWKHDASYREWNLKQSIYRKGQQKAFHIVVPSQWLASAIRDSTLTKEFPISVIPYGLDTGLYKPADRIEARATLNIPTEAHVVLFSADSLAPQRKGFSLLVKAFRQMTTDNSTLLVSLGSGGQALEGLPNYLHLGHFNDDHALALAYSAADVFVIPSLQDNLPNTVLESLACGTPVVGFDTGGIPDMVRPGVTGLLAPAGDVDALQHAIETLLENPSLRAELSHKARRVAEQEYSLAVQSGRYLELYQTLLVEHAERTRFGNKQ